MTVPWFLWWFLLWLPVVVLPTWCFSYRKVLFLGKRYLESILLSKIRFFLSESCELLSIFVFGVTLKDEICVVVVKVWVYQKNTLPFIGKHNRMSCLITRAGKFFITRTWKYYKNMTNYYFIIIFTHFCNEETARSNDDKDEKRQTVHLKFVMYQAITFLTRNIYQGQRTTSLRREKMKYGL